MYMKDIYENLNNDIIDKQIEADFSRWFQEYVSIDLHTNKLMLLFFILYLSL